MTHLPENFQETLIAQAWKDEAFKQQLLNNPKAALLSIGVKISQNVEIEVVEETSNKVYLVLPHKPSINLEVELTEEQLQNVAGGMRSANRTDTATKAPITVCCW